MQQLLDAGNPGKGEKASHKQGRQGKRNEAEPALQKRPTVYKA